MSTAQDTHPSIPSGISTSNNVNVDTTPVYPTATTYPTTTSPTTTKDKLNARMSSAQNAAQDAATKAQNVAANAAEQIKAHPAVKQAQQSAAQYIDQLDKELSKYPILIQLEQRTQIPKAYGVIAAVLVFLSTIFINSLALPVSNLVGWALPAYFSFAALETPASDDDVQWLTYWTVFGFFTFLESLALRPVLYYVPYYFPIKTAFVLWLQLPATRGAVAFHHTVLKPVVNNFRGKRASYTNNYPTSDPYTTQAPAHDKLL